jgi:hypothetical protein
MRRRELQHVILEVGRRFNLKEVFIIGSAAILATMPDPPEGALTMTRDVDIIPPGGRRASAEEHAGLIARRIAILFR